MFSFLNEDKIKMFKAAHVFVLIQVNFEFSMS